MKAAFLVVGAMAVVAAAGAAHAAGGPSDYGIQLTSRLAGPQYMTVQFSGVPFCAGEISTTKPLRCPSVVQPPTMVKVVWGPTTSFGEPAASPSALPAGWKSATGPTQQRNLASGQLTPPWWFRNGDVMLFTVNRMHRLSITYQCDRPGNACVSYIPVTIFGRPQGVTPLAP